jgi:hypothetical protein
MSFRLVQIISWSNRPISIIVVLCCEKYINLLALDALRAITFIVRRTVLEIQKVSNSVTISSNTHLIGTLS